MYVRFPLIVGLFQILISRPPFSFRFAVSQPNQVSRTTFRGVVFIFLQERGRGQVTQGPCLPCPRVWRVMLPCVRVCAYFGSALTRDCPSSVSALHSESALERQCLFSSRADFCDDHLVLACSQNAPLTADFIFWFRKENIKKHKMIYFLTLIIFWKHTVVFYYKSILMNHNRLFCLIYNNVPF